MMHEAQLQALGKEIWVVDYPFKLFGANFGNKMTVIRFNNDNLLLHSPIPISGELIKQIDALGQVKILMAPNLMHTLFINDWKQHYSEATLVAPKHIKKVHFDLCLEDFTKNRCENFEFPPELHLHFIAGMKGLHEYALFHSTSNTLILTDLAFNIRRVKGIWSNIFFRLYGAYGKFGPTHLIKAIIKNKTQFSQSIDVILSNDFDKIVVSHGDVVTENGKAEFKQAFHSMR